ncbi:C2H2-type zinc finger protein [Candidatus Bathyarchaeota archaeon]|nr:C2H2-type zinc finger protein [Candidatus Bathyarchaeota archaeon]
MTEPDFPYSKKPNEPQSDEAIIPPPPDYPPSPPGPPSPPPMASNAPRKFTCGACGKTFTTKEELMMHMETAHQSPKKQV